MDSTLDPESLRERDDVDVRTETRTLTPAEFETARDLESRATIGVVNDAGEALLVADGVRGWTLPSVPVDPNADWDGVARRALESLTGVDAGIDDPVRVRRVEFRQEGASDRRRVTYDVLARTDPVPGRPVADDPTLAGDDVADCIWLDRVPEDAPESVATDVRAVLEGVVD